MLLTPHAHLPVHVYLKLPLIYKWSKNSLDFTYESRNLFLNQTMLARLAYFMIFNKHVKPMHTIGSPTLAGKETICRVHVHTDLRLTWATFTKQ